MNPTITYHLPKKNIDCAQCGMTCRSGGSRSVTMLRVAERVSHSTGAGKKGQI